MRSVIIIVALALCGACSKSDDGKPAKDPGPPPMPEVERKRGKQACDAFVKNLCECAKNKPELKDECELRQARPAALKTVLDVVRSNAEPRVKYKAMKTARKMIADCIERDNKLRAQCPR